MSMQELRFHDYWRIIHRRRYVLLFIFLAVLTSSMVFSFIQTPMFETFSRIQIITDLHSGIEDVTLRFGYLADPYTFVNTEVKTIASINTAEKAALRLNLIKDQDPLQKKMETASQLLTRINAKREGESNIVRIYATGQKPLESADLANEFALSYIENQTEQKLESIRETRRFLEARSMEAQRKLSESEEELQLFKEKFSEYGTSNALASRIETLKIDKSNLFKKYTPQHPDVIKLSSQLSFLEEKLKKLPALEKKLSELSRNVKLNESEYINLSEKLKKAQITEANTTQTVFLVSKAGIPTTPSKPNHRINAMVGSLLGIIIGLVFVFIFENLDTSIGTIEEVEEYMELPVLGLIPHIDLPHAERISLVKRLYYRYFRDRYKKFPVDLRTLIIFHSKKSHFAESYHTLRTNIKFTALGAHGQTLLFTSAGTDEGKTITASNFCIAAATVGIKTLFIEADLRRPVVSSLFGLPRREGLTDLVLGNAKWPEPVYGISDFLLGKLGVENLLHNPAIENLSILPAGTIHTNPVDILGSPEFDAVMENLKKEYTLIVFDCSPVLLFADSIILSKKVEAVVLVYQVGKMARGALKRAKAQLEGVGASVKGVVLNDLRTADMGPQYGYYYYSQYKYYTHEEEKPADKRSTQK